MDHHPIHLHGNQFYVTGTEGGRIPQTAWYPGNTVLVGVGQARDIEFDAKRAGDWMVHCHLPHHMMNQMASMVGPMTHSAAGMHTGMGMEEGMGIVRNSGATSEELGPSLGRGTGLAAHEMPASHLVGQSQTHEHQKAPSQDQDRKLVPGYPQDMFMTMDEAVAKPETYGLAKGWTGAMMGMMTVVRVLPPDMYDKVMDLVKKGRPKGPGPTEHKH